MIDVTPKCPLCGEQMIRHVSGETWFCKYRDCGIAWLTNEQLAKLSAPPAAPPPPANTVRVRATCVVTRDGKWWTIHGMCGDSDADSRAACFADGVDDEWVNVRIITADVPLPTVPEIVGRVEEVKNVEP